MPIEVYKVNENVYIIQQRSLCIKGTQKVFSESLFKWLQSVKYRAAVVLTGASTEDVEMTAGRRIFHINSSAAAHLSLSSLYPQSYQSLLTTVLDIPYVVELGSQTVTTSSRLGGAQVSVFRQRDEKTIDVDLDDQMSMQSLSLLDRDSRSRGESSLPRGMTTARYLVEAAAASADKESGITLVGKFVGEGDNIGDGLDLAEVVVNAFQLLQKSYVTVKDLTHPESWKSRYGHGLRDSNMFY
jgi:hypothetical protein